LEGEITYYEMFYKYAGEDKIILNYINKSVKKIV